MDGVTLGLSTVFDRGKAIIPARVRRKLNVKDGDELVFLELIFPPDAREVVVRANVAAHQEPKARYT